LYAENFKEFSSPGPTVIPGSLLRPPESESLKGNITLENSSETPRLPLTLRALSGRVGA